MSRKHSRRGSLQYWPRKRASRIYPSVNWQGVSAKVEVAKPLGFPCWKCGMTHVQYIDGRPNSPTHNKPIVMPATILDAPPLFVLGFRAYSRSNPLPDSPLISVSETWFESIPKELDLERKIGPGKRKAAEISDISKIVDIRLIVASQPKKSGMKKRTPDVLELGIGGADVAKKLEYAKSALGKEITVDDVFKAGQWVDVSAVTRGRGFTGSIRRFGIKVQGRKDKQMQRHPGSLGSTTPRKVDWRTPMAGQLGFSTRTEFNKRLLAIGAEPEKVNAKGGLLGYGMVKGKWMIVEGSIPGTTKRLIVVRMPVRAQRREIPIELSYISTESKQGL